MRRRSLVSALLALSSPVGAQLPKADLIVINARIYTVDQDHPTVQAFAIEGGLFEFAGSEREVLALRGPETRVLDLHGATVVPGLIDAHAHLLGLGESLQEVDLRGSVSYDEVIARVAARAKTVPAGQWVTGSAWDQNRWGDTRFPTHEVLDRAIPDHPVYLTRVDGHAGLANAAAMKLAGVTSATKDPAGGRIVRDATGNPTGVFVDNARGLIEHVIPPPTHDQMKDALLAAMQDANRWGLTAIDDPGESRAALDAYEELGRDHQMTLRVYALISDNASAIQHYFDIGPRSALYGGFLWVRAIKMYADGAMGSRGAALLEPYSDDPGNVGLVVTDTNHIREVAIEALKHGFQVATHAIGDRGNRLTLDAYEAALDTVPTADHRFRIEHAQILNYEDIPRFAQLGVIPSMQATHATSDMYWVGKRLGATRLYGAYAWRSLLNTGVIIPNGTDFPVEQVNPMLTFHSAVTRQDANNWPPGGWMPQEKMTRTEALESMTLWAAYAGFQDHVMGSITAGKYADFVVLDRDIMAVADEDIVGTNVLATYIGGRAVYQRKP